MNIKDISTQLIYTTVPIYVFKKDNMLSTGTGFIFSIRESETESIPLLITNYHVFDGAIKGFFELHTSSNGEPTHDTLQIQFDQSIVNGNKLGNLDLIAVPIAGTLNMVANRGNQLFYRSVDQHMIPGENQIGEFAAIEDITFIGYPNSLYDVANKISVARKGITATPIWNDFDGKEQFLIDAGVYPGSSGSPVFIYNRGSYPTSDGIAIGTRLLFVGIISQTLKRNNPDDKSYLNLGIVINSRAFYRELKLYIDKIKLDISR